MKKCFEKMMHSLVLAMFYWAIAICHGFDDAVRCLLHENGIHFAQIMEHFSKNPSFDVDAVITTDQTFKDYTLLMLAASRGNISAVKLLVETYHATIDLKSNGKSALDMAREQLFKIPASMPIVAYLVNKKKDQVIRAKGIAVRKSFSPLFQPVQVTRSGIPNIDTVIDALIKQTEFAQSMKNVSKSGSFNINVPVDEQSKHSKLKGCTLLMIAAAAGDLAAVTLLVEEHKADKEVRFKNKRAVDCARELIKNGLQYKEIVHFLSK